MTKRNYAFYPGCSSQKGASGSNFLASIGVMCEKLGIQLNEIPDWNCCGASIGYGEGGELPRLVINARNLALAEHHLPGQDMVMGCPACWLESRQTNERLHEHSDLMAEANVALKEAGLSLKGTVKTRHIVEVLIEDVGFDEIKKPVIKPLKGLKIAGYIGCQTNRPFGIVGESFESPLYLDKMIEAVGAEAMTAYDQKVTCCGGALCFSEQDKTQKQIRAIVESAYDHGAEMIVTPCQLCQANVELYQSQINAKQGTKFAMPVVYYSQLMTVAYGGSIKQAGLDGHVIQPKKLQDIAR
jgi:heterodisulfide reductase subunit B